MTVELNLDKLRDKIDLLDGILVRYSKPTTALTAAGEPAQLRHGQLNWNLTVIETPTPADGDRMFMYFYCDGTERILEISCYTFTNQGIFDLYVNGTLDSSTYDNYSASATTSVRSITLTQQIRPGKNTFELRANSKNGSSAGFGIAVLGASLK